MQESRIAALVLALACGACSADREELTTESAEVRTRSGNATLTAVDAAIDELDRTVAALEIEIAELETINAAKLAEIDSIVSAIEQRKSEIEENRRRNQNNALLFCMFGACDVGAVSLAMAINDDSRIQELNGELARARAEQSSAAAKLESYRADKMRAISLLEDLRATEATLRGVYGGTAPTPSGHGSSTFRKKPSLPKVAQRSRAASALTQNLEAQTEVLQSLLASAGALSVTLDRALVKVDAALSRANALKEASDEEFHELLRIVTASDPSAAADEWLESWVSARTKAAVRELGYQSWDAKEFARHLVAKSAPAGSPPSLLGDLMAALSF